MFKLFMIVGAMFWMLWQLKSYAMLFLVLLFLGGCHPAGSYDVVYMVEVEEEKPAEDTLIYIENITHYDTSGAMSVYGWSYQCGDLAYWTSPFPYDPWYCYHYGDHHVECHWEVGIGVDDYCFDTFAWDDWNCEWVYQFSYCE